MNSRAKFSELNHGIIAVSRFNESLLSHSVKKIRYEVGRVCLQKSPGRQLIQVGLEYGFRLAAQEALNNSIPAELGDPYMFAITLGHPRHTTESLFQDNCLVFV